MLVHSPIFQGQLIERILSLTFLVLMLGGFEKNAKSRSDKCWKNVGKMSEKCWKDARGGKINFQLWLIQTKVGYNFICD